MRAPALLCVKEQSFRRRGSRATASTGQINSEDKSEEKAHRWDETSLEGEWVKGSDK